MAMFSLGMLLACVINYFACKAKLAKLNGKLDDDDDD
jgi:hypothetical protein